jgi:hypothetical protein
MAQPDLHISTLSNQEILDLENQITELAAHIHAASYHLLTLIRKYDQEGGWAGPGLRSCAHWLNWKCGIGMNAAREKVRVAHALADLPDISKAFSKGKVSYSKVRAMTRVATPENEEFLLRIALHGTASHVERAVRQYRRVCRTDALVAEKERHQRRRVFWRMEEDGSWCLFGRFSPDQGERIMKAIESAADEIKAEQTDVPVETAEEPDLNRPMPCRFEQCRADALERIADRFFSAQGGSVHGGDRCTVHVHTDLDSLRQDGSGAEATLACGANVSAETSRRLACDCGVVPWQEKANGDALNVGRKTRSIPPAIRRALQRRDQGCRFPGCTAHKHTDAHHIQHWADGGETSVNNLVTLCRHHHTAVHEGGFGVTMNANGCPEFSDRHGRTIPEAPQTRYRGNIFTLIQANRKNGVDVTAETCIPNWGGESMDDDMVVSALMQMDGFG